MYCEITQRKTLLTFLALLALPACGGGRALTLVHDAPAEQASPKNYRSTDEALKAKPGTKAPSRVGLRELHMSGSGQFTPKGLKTIVERASGPVTVFDLRQESHGFINDIPVTWYGERDWGNRGKTFEEVERDEKKRLDDVAASGRTRLYDESGIKGGATSSFEVDVREAQRENEVAEQNKLSYVRIPVTDHLKPETAEVDRFVRAVRALKPGTWAHLHCRAGKGRTTTFMVMYDMLRNACRVPFEDIVQRQALLGDDYPEGPSREYDVTSFDTPITWKREVQKARADFIREFYAYAKANPNGKGLLWSEWLAARNR